MATSDFDQSSTYRFQANPVNAQDTRPESQNDRNTGFNSYSMSAEDAASIRARKGQPQQAQPQARQVPNIQTRDVNRENVRVDANGNVSSQEGYHDFSLNNYTGHHQGILSTARNRGMGKGGLDLHPETMVTHQGLEMPLRSAERYGLVSRDPQGRYVDNTLGKARR